MAKRNASGTLTAKQLDEAVTTFAADGTLPENSVFDPHNAEAPIRRLDGPSRIDQIRAMRAAKPDSVESAFSTDPTLGAVAVNQPAPNNGDGQNT